MPTFIYRGEPEIFEIDPNPPDLVRCDDCGMLSSYSIVEDDLHHNINCSKLTAMLEQNDLDALKRDKIQIVDIKVKHTKE